MFADIDLDLMQLIATIIADKAWLSSTSRMDRIYVKTTLIKINLFPEE